LGWKRSQPAEPTQDAAAPEPVVNGFFRGREQLVSGWILDLKDPSRKHDVEVFVDGKSIGRARGDRFDQMVQSQHGGDGKYAFALYYDGELDSGPLEASVVDTVSGDTLRSKQPMVNRAARSGPPLAIEKLAIGSAVQIFGRIGAYPWKDARIELWSGGERVVSALPLDVLNEGEGLFSARIAGDALRHLLNEDVSIALPGLYEAGLAVPNERQPVSAVVSEREGVLHVELRGSFEQSAPIPIVVRSTAADGRAIEEEATIVSKAAAIPPRSGRNIDDGKVEVLLPGGIAIPTRVEWRLLENPQFRDLGQEASGWTVSEGAQIERGFFAFPPTVADRYDLSGHIAHLSAAGDGVALLLSQSIGQLPAPDQHLPLTALVRAPKKAKLAIRLRDDEGVITEDTATSRNADSWTILTLEPAKRRQTRGAVIFEVEASGRKVDGFDVALGNSTELETSGRSTASANLLVNDGLCEWPYGAGVLEHDIRGAACTGWRIFNRKSEAKTLTRPVMDAADGTLGLAVAARDVPNYLKVEADFAEGDIAGQPLVLRFRAGVVPAARQLLSRETAAVSRFAVIDRALLVRRRRITTSDRFEEKDEVAAVFGRKIPVGYDIESFSFAIPGFDEPKPEDPEGEEVAEESYHLAFEFRQPTVIALFDVQVVAEAAPEESAPSLELEDRNIQMQVDTLVSAAHWAGPTPVRMATYKTAEQPEPLKWSASVSREPVEIVIPVFNALGETLACLDSINGSTAVPLLVRLIDDGSDPPVGEALKAYVADKPWISLHSFDSNRGYTYASDFGIRQGSTAWVVLLNSDTIVTRGWLEGMLACAKTDDAIGFVGPLSNAASYQSVPELYDAARKWKVNRLPPGVTPDDMAAIVRRASLKAYPRVPLLNGFCTMMKRSLFIELGGLNPGAFPTGYGEENDLCLRAAKAGIELAVADDVYVYHVKSASFGNARRTELTKTGNSALKTLHPDVDISALTAKFRETPALVAVRDGVARELSNLHSPLPEAEERGESAGPSAAAAESLLRKAS
jgi:GT2 family glycosyltransferase